MKRMVTLILWLYYIFSVTAIIIIFSSLQGTIEPRREVLKENGTKIPRSYPVWISQCLRDTKQRPYYLQGRIAWPLRKLQCTVLQSSSQTKKTRKKRKKTTQKMRWQKESSANDAGGFLNNNSRKKIVYGWTTRNSLIGQNNKNDKKKRTKKKHYKKEFKKESTRS